MIRTDGRYFYFFILLNSHALSENERIFPLRIKKSNFLDIFRFVSSTPSSTFFFFFFFVSVLGQNIPKNTCSWFDSYNSCVYECTLKAHIFFLYFLAMFLKALRDQNVFSESALYKLKFGMLSISDSKSKQRSSIYTYT